MGQHVIEAKELKKNYIKGKSVIEAIKNISLTVDHGEFVSIVGPSGSGKSTLLHLLGVLDTPTEGKIVINGNDISKINRKELSKIRRSIGFVFQSYNLIDRLTVFQNVDLALGINGKFTDNERMKKVEEMLKMLGLWSRANHKPNELSGGQQQRTAIARALITNPEFLLMDEPTGNVDTETRNKILILLKSLHKNDNITIIVITHDPVVAEVADKRYILIDGVISK